MRKRQSYGFPVLFWFRHVWAIPALAVTLLAFADVRTLVTEPSVWLLSVFVLAALAIGVVSDLRTPKMLVLRDETLTVRWRKTEDVVGLSDLAVKEKRNVGYPAKSMCLQYGGKTVKVPNALEGYESLLSELQVRCQTRNGTSQPQTDER